MKEQQTAGQEGIFTRKLLRNLTFADLHSPNT